jgi:hypothetical protein
MPKWFAQSVTCRGAEIRAWRLQQTFAINSSAASHGRIGDAHCPFSVSLTHVKLLPCGGSSSAGRASVCGTECRGFNPRLPPQTPAFDDISVGVIRTA